MIQAPQSFVVSQECQKVTWENGYRLEIDETDGWRRYGSTTAKGTVWLAAAGQAGPWFMALGHPGVVDELGETRTDIPGPGLARYGFATLTALYAAISQVYRLGVSLPDGPLEEFQAATTNLPRTTEAERLIVQRIGQDIFRDRLMTYWKGRCPLTGITDPDLLRASHIVPWKDCDDAERLNVYNGLLLSALWDAAFDRCLVTFGDDGLPEFSPILSHDARAELRWHAPLPLTEKHRSRLAWHRARMATAGHHEDRPPAGEL